MSPSGWRGGEGVTAETARAGLVDRIAGTLSDPRGAVRREIREAGEPRLFLYAFLASLLAVMTAIGEQAVAPNPEVTAEFSQWAATQAASGAFFRPLALYGVAGLMGLAARRLGGVGEWRATRAAVFWTALAAAPFALILGLAGATLGAATGLGASAAAAGHAAGAGLWAVILAPGLAEAHGLSLGRGVAAMAAPAAAGLLLAGIAAALA